MGGNQRQVPVIQTSDSNITQLQQNSNKVLRNLSNQIISLQASVDQMQDIGDIRFSALSLTQFQSFAGDTWIEANGQSSVGTKYANLTGNTTVPTVSVSGSNAFIKVN